MSVWTLWVLILISGIMVILLALYKLCNFEHEDIVKCGPQFSEQGYLKVERLDDYLNRFIWVNDPKMGENFLKIEDAETGNYWLVRKERKLK